MVAPKPPRGRQLGGAAHDPAGAEVLETDDDLLVAHDVERAIGRAHQHVLEERIGHLDRALVCLGVLVVEHERRKRGPAETAAVRRLADEHDVPTIRVRAARASG